MKPGVIENGKEEGYMAGGKKGQRSVSAERNELVMVETGRQNNAYTRGTEKTGPGDGD